MAARRFEIRGIRSWRKAKRDRNGGGRGETEVTPASASDTDLGAVLDRWDRQLAREEKEQRSAEDQKERFREESHRRLRAVIAPALERIGREVGDRGHAWTIEERIDIQAQPAIACTFRPAAADGKRRGASELCFRFQFSDRLAVTGFVALGGGLEDLPARSYPIGDLDAALVKREVARLISAALDPRGEDAAGD